MLGPFGCGCLCVLSYGVACVANRSKATTICRIPTRCNRQRQRHQHRRQQQHGYAVRYVFNLHTNDPKWIRDAQFSSTQTYVYHTTQRNTTARIFVIKSYARRYLMWAENTNDTVDTIRKPSNVNGRKCRMGKKKINDKFNGRFGRCSAAIIIIIVHFHSNRQTRWRYNKLASTI